MSETGLNRVKEESIGVDCQPRCGNCICGRCALGTKRMSLKEDFELMEHRFTVELEELPNQALSMVQDGSDPAMTVNIFP